jgi:hypothetical protein
MSLSDIVGATRHMTNDRASVVETIAGWLAQSPPDRTAGDDPTDHRAARHALREKGYLHDIGV